VLRRLEQIERLPRRKQTALLTTIDAFLQALRLLRRHDRGHNPPIFNPIFSIAGSNTGAEREASQGRTFAVRLAPSAAKTKNSQAPYEPEYLAYPLTRSLIAALAGQETRPVFSAA
jgi:hypothetical protein